MKESANKNMPNEVLTHELLVHKVELEIDVKEVWDDKIPTLNN
ncbi:hypothetical protein [Nitrosomonas sp. JL21]|nr:hypothetical protein [Nitrosomonas sp. JL21]